MPPPFSDFMSRFVSLLTATVYLHLVVIALCTNNVWDELELDSLAGEMTEDHHILPTLDEVPDLLGLYRFGVPPDHEFHLSGVVEGPDSTREEVQIADPFTDLAGSSSSAGNTSDGDCATVDGSVVAREASGPPSISRRKGSGVRKRPRPVSPPAVDTDSRHQQGGSRYRGVTGEIAKVCLEEMIVAPNAGMTEFTDRVLARVPTADRVMVRNYRSTKYARTRAPLWFHNVLMAAARKGLSHAEITTEAQSYMHTSGEAWHGSIVRSVREWMRYCVEPLLAHPESSPEHACMAYQANTGKTAMQLSGTQFRLFIESELGELLTVGPTLRPPTKRAPRRRVSLRETQVAVKPPGAGGGRMTNEEKRVCLQMLIDEPDLLPSQLSVRSASRLPHAPLTAMKAFFKNAANQTRFPISMHQYLLSRRADVYSDELVADMLAALGAGMPAMRGGIRVRVRLWVQYCIAPSLAHPENAKLFCYPETRRGRAGSARLAPTQRIAVYTDILTALGTEGDAEDPTDDELTFVNTDTDP